MSNATTEMTLEALRSVPLFASLDDNAAIELRSLLTVENVSSGSRLFHKGDSGDAMFLIESGRVHISINDEDGQEVTLARHRPGTVLGEMSVFDDQPRSASAQAMADTTPKPDRAR